MGQETETDILLRIRDHADDAGELLLDEVIHDRADDRRTGGIHEFQAAQVGEQPKAWLYLFEELPDLVEAGFHLDGVHPTRIVEGEPLSGVIQIGEKHTSL